jgi:4-diphosphocytidyl-2-C-methyl-D-erythritol kinase
MLARSSRLAPDDPRLLQAARATGADVPVCLDPRPRLMRGIGEILSEPLDLPKLATVLVNPGVAVPTREVFAALRLPAGSVAPAAPSRSATSLSAISLGASNLADAIANGRNDLEGPAIELQPVIADVLAALRKLPGCRLSRMSGSGATCFGLFDSTAAATAAARTLRIGYPAWWVRATVLGG